jgi:hypothetical protein
LRQADPPSRNSYGLCKKIKKLKTQPRSNKEICRAIERERDVDSDEQADGFCEFCVYTRVYIVIYYYRCTQNANKYNPACKNRDENIGKVRSCFSQYLGH